MRLIILTIFAICMAGTVKAQTDFDFACELTCSDATAAIAAIPDAMMDADDGTFYDRVEYINEIIPPDGFSVFANAERVVIHEGIYPGGTQRWKTGEVDYYEYDQFNIVYKNIHRVLINLKYGCELEDGVIEIN